MNSSCMITSAWYVFAGYPRASSGSIPRVPFSLLTAVRNIWPKKAYRLSSALNRGGCRPPRSETLANLLSS